MSKHQSSKKMSKQQQQWSMAQKLALQELRRRFPSVPGKATIKIKSK
jgi:hypothetical protein